MEALKPVVITKRKVSRTVFIPDHGPHSWRGERASEAKFYRFKETTTEYKRGQLTIVFDLTGKPIEAWSYWTCLYAYAEPTEDHPQGRLIKNITGYGSYTGKHDGEAMWYFYGPADTEVTRTDYSRVYKKTTRSYGHSGGTYETHRVTKAYTTELKTSQVNAQWTFAAELIHCDYGTSPARMRAELASNLAGHTAQGERYVESKARSAMWAAEREASAAAQRANAHAQGVASGAIIDLGAQRAKAVV